MLPRKKRLFIVPRWSGRPDGEWYAWLKAELEAMQGNPFEVVSVLDMPDPDLPRIQKWIPAISKAVGDDIEELERTILVGHSIGCQAILHFLAMLPVDRRILGVLCVAGFWTVDDPWDSIRPWLEKIPDLDRVRAAADQFIVLLSRDDPVSSDVESSQARWEKSLGASVTVVPDGYHFMKQEEPLILESIQKYFF